MTYEVGLGESGTVHLCVAANEGGGYFSSEWVSLPRILEVLADFLSSGGSFPTHALLPAFNNRSVNNAGFLAAILRHEGLLKAGDKPHSHACCGDWAAWQAAQRDAQRLAETGAFMASTGTADVGADEHSAMAAESSEKAQDAGNETEAFEEGLDDAKAVGVVEEVQETAHQQGTDESAGPQSRKGNAGKRAHGRQP